MMTLLVHECRLRMAMSVVPLTGLQPDSAAAFQSARAIRNVWSAFLLDLYVHVCLVVRNEAALHRDDLRSSAPGITPEFRACIKSM